MADRPKRVAANAKPLKSPGVYLVAGAVALGAVTVLVGTATHPNRLATSLLQAITLVFGTVGSWWLGRDTSRVAAREAIRPHARSAFRRVQTLYEALGRLKRTAEVEAEYLIDSCDEDSVRLDLALASLDKVRLMSQEQIATADNALDDWRDLAPEEVAEVLRAAKQEPDAVHEAGVQS